MTTVIQLITRLYAMLVRLYPDSFHAQFEEEMQGLFEDAVTDVARRGKLVCPAQRANALGRMKSRLVLLTLILSASLLLTSCSVVGDSIFVIAEYIFGGPTYRDVALGDVDGDGDLDAFLANGRNEDVVPNTVWLNDGTGRFHDSGQRLGTDLIVDSHSVALGDFDADGDLDALVLNSRWLGPGRTGEVLKNDGQGRFITQQWLSDPEDSGAPRLAVALGDVDGDGDLTVL